MRTFRESQVRLGVSFARASQSYTFSVNDQPRLVLLPGMGCDRRLFEPQFAAFPRLEVPPWLEPRHEESLTAYGRRMAATVADDGPIVLGGMSMGGMVALEMARYLPVKRVILIASCRSGRCIRRSLCLPERLARPLPALVYKALHPAAPLLIRGGRLSDQQRALFVTMVRDTDHHFLKWACGAILRWSFDAGGAAAIPIAHIHGRQDWLIPAERVQPDALLPGGHMIHWSHTEAVNDFIREQLAR